MPRIEILTIGDELVEGRLVDTNAFELSAKLTDLGFRVTEHRSVGDDMDGIIEALCTAAGRADAVLVSGGLGPTSDDLSAAAAAGAFALEIKRSAEALDHTRRFFSERGREMPPSNEKQADLPAGCTILPNPEGTAVGFSLDVGQCRLYFMPGVPREIRRMAENSVFPDMAQRLVAAPPVVATLKIFGKGESEVAQRLEGLEQAAPEGFDLLIQYRATFPEIHVRLVVEGPDQSAAAVLERLTKDARQRLGRHVFAVGGHGLDIDFPGFVAATLAKTGMTLAAAEVASCGAVARMLGASEDGRQCLRGSLIAGDIEVLKNQLVLEGGSAEEAAAAVRARFGASIGVATYGSAEGVADHRPGTLKIAAAGPNGVQKRELYFPIDSDRFQRLAAYAALRLAVRAIQQEP